MLIIRGGINSKKRELCPTALALSAFYYNKNKHADTYIMYLHAYSTRDTRKSAHCLWLVGHTPGESKRGRDTESDAKSVWKKSTHFSPPNGSGLFSFQNLSVLLPPYNNTYSSTVCPIRQTVFCAYLFYRNQLLLASDIRTQCYRNIDASVCVEVVL